MATPLRTDDGFLVVQLKENRPATREEFDKDKDTYLEDATRQKRAEALALYVKRLKEAGKAEIKIDEKYMADKMGSSRDGGAPDLGEDEEEGP